MNGGTSGEMKSWKAICVNDMSRDVCEAPKFDGGQPPIMSASKTRALMATVCLQGGLLHSTVLQEQRQIYKTTIRRKKSIKMPLKWNKLPILLMWSRVL